MPHLLSESIVGNKSNADLVELGDQSLLYSVTLHKRTNHFTLVAYFCQQTCYTWLTRLLESRDLFLCRGLGSTIISSSSWVGSQWILFCCVQNNKTCRVVITMDGDNLSLLPVASSHTENTPLTTTTTSLQPPNKASCSHFLTEGT